MDILKLATSWAKAEVFSSKFFLLFGIIFVLATLGFWQFGKTETARAYIYPSLIAGALLLTIGFGIFFPNKSRIASFHTAYHDDPAAFVKSEISRAEKTMGEYQNIAFKVAPIIIIVAALVFIFIDKPIWRAISTTTIALMVIILWIDSNANARIENYHQQLVLEEKKESS